MRVRKYSGEWASSMKTHQLARYLRNLADLLLDGPNVELQNLSLAPRHIIGRGRRSAVGLHTLLNLSKVSKREWLALVKKYEIPLQVRPRDAARDILDKLLRYLADNESARDTLRKGISAESEEASQELLRSLGALLGEREEGGADGEEETDTLFK